MRFIAVLLCWAFFHATLSGQIVLLRRKKVAAAGGGPVTYDNSTLGKCVGPGGTGTECTTDTTLTFSHTTGSGSHRALDVFCAVSGGSATVQPAISTMTYATVSMTEIATAGGNYRLRHWALPNGTEPTTGANNVVVVLAAALATTQSVLSCAAISWAGVDQTNQFSDSGDAASGSDATAEWSFTTVGSSDLGVIAVCNGTSVGTSTNATVRQDAADDGNGACNTLGLATAAAGVSSGVWTVGNDSWLTLTAVKKGG